MAEEKFNYEEAIKQLQLIADNMESGEMNIDSITKDLKKAKELIKLCKDKLTKTENEIKEIMQ